MIFQDCEKGIIYKFLSSITHTYFSFRKLISVFVTKAIRDVTRDSQLIIDPTLRKNIIFED